MTTRPYVLIREAARDWAIFGQEELSVDIGVLSIEVQRRWDESIASVTEDAATLLAVALDSMLRSRHGRLWLVALGRPIPRQNKVAILHAEREGLWKALASSGVELPEGNRSESEMPTSPDVLQFGGYIDLITISRDLQAAFEVTRRENAVILGQFGDGKEPDWMSFLSSINPLPRDSMMLLRASIHEVGGEYFAARSYGRFDDVKVGVEVFADEDVLNGIALALESQS